MTATKTSYTTCPFCEATCGSGTRMHVAAEHAGVNTNILADEEDVDPLSGNAILNGIAVRVQSKNSEVCE